MKKVVANRRAGRTDVVRRAVVEVLEKRSLLAVTLPYVNDFSSPTVGLADKDGQATGLTEVQQNTAGNAYRPDLIDLDTAAGVLKITSTGSSSTGTNRGTGSTLTNGLLTTFDGDASGWTIDVTLQGPLTYLDRAYEQAGILFGPDMDNFIRVVVERGTSSTTVKFSDEQLLNGSPTQTFERKTTLTNQNTITSITLRLTGDAYTRELRASYAINGSTTFTVVGGATAKGTIDPSTAAAFFNGESRAGVMALHKNNVAPETFAFDTFRINAGVRRPSFGGSTPAPGATNVRRDSFVGIDPILPNAALDPETVTTSTVRLVKVSNGQTVLGSVNSSGGGDSIVFQPGGFLDADTTYRFEITSGVEDITGAAFVPYSFTFTTGTEGGPVETNLNFEKVALPTTQGNGYTGVTFGPDNKLYAVTADGRVIRWSVNADGTLGSSQTINSLQTLYGGPRLGIGITFDPASTANNLIAYVTHGFAAFDDAPEWSSAISMLSGVNLQNARDVVVNLPRAAHNHLVNQAVFGPDGALYVSMGGNTAHGAIDTVWGLRPERLLNAAVLRVDLHQLSANAPFDVKTEEVATPYNPFAPNAPVTIYATGMRNAYDIVWTEDGRLFAPNNGSNPGGATPGTPSLPDPNSVRIDGDDDANPNNGMYAGPAVPGIPNVSTPKADHLYDVRPNKYYGHPNPSRSEYVHSGGNPTSGSDPEELPQYPVGTLPDRNYATAAWNFGTKRSPNGIIEFNGTQFDGALDGALMVVRYSGGDDVLILQRNAQGNVTNDVANVPGLTGFVGPLDLIQSPTTGFIYVAEYDGERITLVRAVDGVPDKPATPTVTNASPGAVAIAWAPVGGATGYTVQRRAPGETGFTTIGNATAARFFDTAVTAGASYQYRVMASNTLGASEPSDPVTAQTAPLGVWSNTTPMPANAAELNGVTVGGKAYFFSENDFRTFIYDFASDTWSTAVARPIPGDLTNSEHNVEAVGTKIYLIGGLTGGAENKVQIFDTVTQTWSLGADVPYNAGSANSAVIDGKIYIAGGAVTTPSYAAVKKAAVYDPVANSWTTLPDMPTGRHSSASGTDGQKFYVFGGRNAGLEASDGTNSVMIYDPLTNLWTTSDTASSGLTPLPRPARGVASKAIFYNGEFFVMGGENSSGQWEATANKVQFRVDVYNAVTNTWRRGPDMPIAKHAFGAVLNGNEILVAGGGIQSGTSASNGASILDLSNNGLPSAPGAFSAVVQSTTQLQLQWLDTSLNESSFKVYRSLNGVDYTELAVLPAGAVAYTDSTVLANQTYFYRVDAVNSVGATPSAIINTSTTPTAPAAASLLTAVNVGGGVKLDWVDNAGNETAFDVYRSTDGTTYSLLVSTLADVITYTDPTVSPSTLYYYRVVARNTIGISDPSNTAQVTTANPNAVTSLDINTGAQAGSTTPLSGVGNFNVVAGGSDIFGSNDGFRFVYREATGDFDVVVRVASLTQTADSAKAGLMARSLLTANSPNIFAGITPVEGLRYISRATAGASAVTNYRGGNFDLPEVHLRLKRVGNTFTAFASTDGVNWTQFHSKTQTMPATLFLGLATSARTTSALTTAAYRGLADFGVAAPTIPAAPAGLVATGGSGAIALSWADQSNNETAFDVYRSTDGTTFGLLTSVGPDIAAYSDTQAVGGVPYTYRIVARNAAGSSTPSNTATATATSATLPAAPTGLAAAAVSGGVSLQWTDESSNETAFDIFRSTDGTNFLPLASVNANVGSYTDSAVASSTTYAYRVVARNAAGSSAASNTASATTGDFNALTALNIGTGVANGSTTVLTPGADYDIVAGGVDIWNSADSFRYDYRTLSGDFDLKVLVESLSGNGKAGLMARETLAANSRNVFSGMGTDAYRLSYRNTTGAQTLNKSKLTSVLLPAKYVRLRRVGDVFTGFHSTDGVTWTQASTITMTMASTIYVGLATSAKTSTATVSVAYRAMGDFGSTTPAPTIPAAPGSLAASPVAGGIALQWADLSNNEAAFDIVRSTDGTTFTPLASVAANATTYTDASAVAGTLYSYKVVARNTAGVSADSNVASATAPTPTAPAAPTSLTAVPSGTGVALTWTDNASNETAYDVFRSTNGTMFSPLTSLAAGATTYTDNAVDLSTTYFYRVVARNAVGSSAVSNTASATTNAAATLTSLDIGNGVLPGSTTPISAGSDYDVTAGGIDVWNSADNFRFDYLSLTGDFDFMVRIDSLTAADPTAKAGLMARESLDANSRNIFSGMTAGDGYRLGHRSTTGGQTVNKSKVTSAGAAPKWVRLRRVGDVFTGFYGNDGVAWSSGSSITVAMPGTIFFGLATAAKSNTIPVTATYRSLTDLV